MGGIKNREAKKKANHVVSSGAGGGTRGAYLISLSFLFIIEACTCACVRVCVCMRVHIYLLMWVHICNMRIFLWRMIYWMYNSWLYVRTLCGKTHECSTVAISRYSCECIRLLASVLTWQHHCPWQSWASQHQLSQTRYSLRVCLRLGVLSVVVTPKASVVSLSMTLKRVALLPAGPSVIDKRGQEVKCMYWWVWNCGTFSIVFTSAVLHDFKQVWKVFTCHASPI